LNDKVENVNMNGKSITVKAVVRACDEDALAKEISHLNPLIPEQVAKSVLDNFCEAALNLMSMGFAVHLKNGKDVAMRLYPDVRVDGGSINLQKAQELDPAITELTLDNASELVAKAGLTVKVKAECQHKFSERLHTRDFSLQKTEVVER
jgi:hypothetical protein